MEQVGKVDTRTFALMKRLLKESIQPYKSQVVIALIFMFISSAAASMSMMILKPVFDYIFVAKDEKMLWALGVSIIFIYIIKSIAHYGQATSMSWLGLRIVTDLQVKLYDHYMRMDLTFFHQNQTGTLVSRVSNDAVLMRDTATKVVTSAGKDVTQLIGMTTVMLYTNWQLALLALIVFSCYFGADFKNWAPN